MCTVNTSNLTISSRLRVANPWLTARQANHLARLCVATVRAESGRKGKKRGARTMAMAIAGMVTP
jgi:hypothetical protein